jgi:AraC family transcriptional activator of pobA
MDLPLFHLYGDPADPRAFNFVHAERIPFRCSIHNWRICIHRHANLAQILIVERGGGEMECEASTITFCAPAVIVVPPTLAHGFQFQSSTDGWVVSFTDDVIRTFGDPSGETIAQLKKMAADPVVSAAKDRDIARLSELCAALAEERLLSRRGYHVAAGSYLALIAIEVGRLVSDRGGSPVHVGDEITDSLLTLIEDNFRDHRLPSFYAAKLSITCDRLNKHVKRMTGATAGQLIRQRALTEAKRQLVYSSLPINDIAYDLAYADPSHFARSFRKDTGVTPGVFREKAGRST